MTGMIAARARHQTAPASTMKSPPKSSAIWGRAGCLGPALGQRHDHARSWPAAQCHHRAGLFRDQHSDPLGSGDQRRLLKAHARETGEQAPSIPFLKLFTVFNVDQCENLPEDYAAVTTPPLPNTILPQAVARIVVSGADFRIGGDRAFHVRALDNVQVPPPRAYFDPINGHRTALHKLCHCICLEKRLARDFSGSFGSKSDTCEELVA